MVLALLNLFVSFTVLVSSITFAFPLSLFLSLGWNSCSTSYSSCMSTLDRSSPSQHSHLMPPIREGPSSLHSDVTVLFTFPSVVSPYIPFAPGGKLNSFPSFMFNTSFPLPLFFPRHLSSNFPLNLYPLPLPFLCLAFLLCCTTLLCCLISP